jgi:hypothetical protein
MEGRAALRVRKASKVRTTESTSGVWLTNRTGEDGRASFEVS